ncbi:PTS sugar transporter subunit IIA [Rothia sp. CCM 9418]|uniref:PTS sugar transporter subunit IIA n=1 Tax=Rothia sp. CCM 9418 TaxID=3402661 RepID=UPI003ADACB69
MTQLLDVYAPCAGELKSLSDVPDEVFSQKIVGEGIAIEPTIEDDETFEVTAPFDGTILKLMPHAFVIAASTGEALLVHVGIDTVEFAGEGFEHFVQEKDSVTRGQKLMKVDASALKEAKSLMCPVVALKPTQCTLVPVENSTLSTETVVLQLSS